MQHLTLEIRSIEESPKYNEQDQKWNYLNLSKVIIIKKGMESGLPSFDFQLEHDYNGEKAYFVSMVSFGILESIYKAALGVIERENKKEN